MPGSLAILGAGHAIANQPSIFFDLEVEHAEADEVGAAVEGVLDAFRAGMAPAARTLKAIQGTLTSCMKSMVSW